MAVLGYLQKLKRHLGQILGAHFVYDKFWTGRDWHIFVASIVRTLIFHILPPETCSLSISKKVPKICKIVEYFEVTS